MVRRGDCKLAGVLVIVGACALIFALSPTKNARRRNSLAAIPPPPNGKDVDTAVASDLRQIVWEDVGEPGAPRMTDLRKSRRLAACLRRALRAKGAYRTPAGKPVIAVTSTTSSWSQHAAARKEPWKRTIWADTRFLPPLVIYHEDKWEKAHGRPPIDRAAFPKIVDAHGNARPTCFVDVFDAAPNLLPALLTTHKRMHPKAAGWYHRVFERFYSIPGTRTLSQQIMDGKALVRKMVAMAHAALHLEDGALVVWLDVDTGVKRPLDGNPNDDEEGGSAKAWHHKGSDKVHPTFIEYTTHQRDVCYIAETDCWRAVTLPPGGGRPIASFWEMAEWDAPTDGRVWTKDARGRKLLLDFSSVARQYNGHGGTFFLFRNVVQ